MARSELEDDVAEVLIDEATLQAKVTELGAMVSSDYADREVTLVSVLKGSLPFMADLMRAISIPVRIDLMEVSSYGGETETSGTVRILKDLSSSIEDRDVLIVEDIIDTGLTLNYLTGYLQGRGPRTLRICALLDKPARRLVEIDIAYRGFTIPTASSSATASTTTSSTATCRTSASCGRRSTARREARSRPRARADRHRRGARAHRRLASLVHRRRRGAAGRERQRVRWSRASSTFLASVLASWAFWPSPTRRAISPRRSTERIVYAALVFVGIVGHRDRGRHARWALRPPERA